jgi:phenylalanyl-tRNA synthetase beta subunit
LAKNFFEIANVYQPIENQQLPDEVPTLCVSTDQSITTLKSTLEVLFDKLNQNNYSYTQDSELSANVFNNDQWVGVIKQIPSQIQNNFGLVNKVSVIEISLPKLLSSLNTIQVYTPTSEYPDLKFDITITSKEPVGEIIKKIKNYHPSIAVVKYLNSYHSKHSFQISLRSYTENLTKDFGNTIQQSLLVIPT